MSIRIESDLAPSRLITSRDWKVLKGQDIANCLHSIVKYYGTELDWPGNQVSVQIRTEDHGQDDRRSPGEHSAVLRSLK